MKNGGPILRNAVAVCEMSMTSWQMGRRITKGDLENHWKGPEIPSGSMVEHHPISSRDQTRLHQFGKKVLPGKFLGYALYAV